jgi:capsular exopolysaccharide synthesis family protein
MDNSAVEYSLLDYAAIMWKRWLWVLIPLVVLSAAAVVWTVTRPLSYEAEARVFVGPTVVQQEIGGASQNIGALNRELENERNFAFSDDVEQRVEAALGELPSIRITPATEGDVLVFRAPAGDPDEAALNANTWADKYIEAKRADALAEIETAAASLQQRLVELRVERQEVRADLDALDERIARASQAGNEELAASLQRDYDRLADTLQFDLGVLTSEASATSESLAQLRREAVLAAIGEARIVQAASAPVNTTNAPLSRNLALGIVLGFLAGFGLALLAETRDTRLKGPSDLQELTDLPVLASIPEARKREEPGLALATHRDPEGVYANAYHKVRSSLEFLTLDGDISSVLITSAGATEGKTTTSCNLALAYAMVGKRTVLADVDFRRARIHSVFGIERAPGLSDTVIHQIPMASVGQSVAEPGLESLLVIPAGTAPPSPSAFVGTKGFRDTVAWLGDQADLVVFDAPPMLAVSDPHTLAKSVDGVILTVRANSTTRRELMETINALRTSGANMLGLVLVGVDDSEVYGRYYSYESTDSSNGNTAAPSKGDLWSTSRPAEEPIQL